MFSHAEASVATVVGRRGVVGMLAVMALPLATLSVAQPAAAESSPADAIATIKQFNAALLSTMKVGARADFGQRFEALEPAVDLAFDLPAVLSVSVGPAWASLPAPQRGSLLDAFRRYTVASYVANFDHYSGQSFSVLPRTRDVGAGRLVVQSRIQPVSGDPTELDYVMQQTGSGWKIVDVLAAGSISRVAVQRSDFRHLLSSGGGGALLASLQRKTSDLSGGAVA
ncbi:ABC transporter substrate-binding protein [Rhodopila sp.]|uniref:ABC transporter substrate-binding protein n=1 Tax=Rhodopila sp. TaxID=2480087 RepID=UPI003D10DA8E